MSFIGGEDDLVAVGISLESDGTTNGFRIRGAPALAIYGDELASKTYVDNAAVTSGVSQIIAGAGIAVNQGTGAVTVSSTDVNTYLPLAGGTMTGAINMGSGSISNGNNASFNSVSTDAINAKSGGNIGVNASVGMNGFGIINAGSVETNSITSGNAIVQFGKTIDTGTYDVVTNGLECTTIQNPTASSPITIGSSFAMSNGGIDMGDFNIVAVGQLAATSVVSSGINANSSRITNVANPSASTDAANKAYVDASIPTGGPFVPLSGGVAGAMTGQLYASQGIQMNSSSISGGSNAAFNSVNTDQINAKASVNGPVLFTGPIALTDNLGVARDIQGANAITCKSVTADTQLQVGNVIMGPGGFNMFQGVISNLADTTSSAPTNAINYQTAAALVAPKANLTYVDAAVAPKADTTYVDNNRVRTNVKYANDVASSAEIQERVDEITSQGWTIQIAPGSYGGIPVGDPPVGAELVIHNKTQVGLNAVQVGGVTATEIGTTGNPRQTKVTGTSESIRFQSLSFKGLVTLNSSKSKHNFDHCNFGAGLTIGPTLPTTDYLRFYWCEFQGTITIPMTITIPIFFINCSFAGASFANVCTPAVVFANCAGIPVSNTAGSTAAGGNSYSDLTVKFENNQGGDTYLRVAGTNKRIRLSQVPTVDAGTTPADDRDLTTKDYVDSEVALKVAAVNAGTGITVDGAANSPTINNAGVLELTAGSNITITGTKSNYTISSSGGGGGSGVQSVAAGNGITVDNTDPQNPVVANSGILALGVGTGLSSTGGQSPTLQNTGVIELTAGSNVTITGSKTNYTISSSVGGGVQSVTGGIGIGITGTQLNPTISATGVTRVTAGTGISVQNIISPTENLQQVTNTGVTSLVAGSNITLSGSTGAVTISATGGGGGGGGISSITAGEAITVTGTSSDPVISQSRFRYLAPSLAAGSLVIPKNFFGYQYVSANPNTGTLIITGLPGATTATAGARPILRSIDNGATWDVPSLTNPVTGSETDWLQSSGNLLQLLRCWYLNGRWFTTQAGGLLASNRILTSDDDGLTWTFRTTPTGSDDSSGGVRDMAGDGGELLMAVTGTSQIKWNSNDNGNTWTRALSAASGTGAVNYLSCAYGVSNGTPVWVFTTESTTAANRIQFSTDRENWTPAFGTGTAPWSGTPVFIKVLWVPTKNKFYFFSTVDLQGVGGTQSAGTTTTLNPGLRVFASGDLSQGAGNLPFDNPQNFFFVGGHTPRWAVCNNAGDIFSCTDANATTGYKVLYQKASNTDTFVPCEVMTSTETVPAVANNHDFTYDGTRWIGIHGRNQARTGRAFIIQAPLVLP